MVESFTTIATSIYPSCPARPSNATRPSGDAVTMASVSRSIRDLGGIAGTFELRRAGHTPTGIFAAVKAGDAIRVRKGWYANVGTDPDVIRAWRVGGQLACVSAAAHHHLWVPELPEILHVAVPPLAARLRTPSDFHRRLADVPDPMTRVHWTGTRSGDRTAVSVSTALDQIFHCQPIDVGFVIFESALHLGRLDVFEFHELLDRVPKSARRLMRLADGNSESGSESLLKLMLTRRAIPFRQQVQIGDIGRVDFLIGDRLVIEVDSKLHHSDPYNDRRRDAELSIDGRRVLRFMYSQVVHEMPTVEAAIISALARSDHNHA